MRNLTLLPRAGALLRLALRLAKTAEEHKDVPNTQNMGSPQEADGLGHGLSDHSGNDASLRKFLFRKYSYTDKTPGDHFSGEHLLRPLFWDLSECVEPARGTEILRPTGHANGERFERRVAQQQPELPESRQWDRRQQSFPPGSQPSRHPGPEPRLRSRAERG